MERSREKMNEITILLLFEKGTWSTGYISSFEKLINSKWMRKQSRESSYSFLLGLHSKKLLEKYWKWLLSILYIVISSFLNSCVLKIRIVDCTMNDSTTRTSAEWKTLTLKDLLHASKMFMHHKNFPNYSGHFVILKKWLLFSHVSPNSCFAVWVSNVNFNNVADWSQSMWIKYLHRTSKML